MSHLTPEIGEWEHRHGEAGLALRGAGATVAASVLVAVLQSTAGTLLDGFGLEGWRVGVAAAFLGVVDAMLLICLLLLLLWGIAWLTRAPREIGLRSVVVVVAALLASVLVELTACLAELAATGEISERLVTDPARWLGADGLGGLSVSNLAVYAVTAVGSVRYLGWTAWRAGILVAVIASIATASSVAL